MKYAYINGIILDGTENMEPLRNMTVFTDGERIEDIKEYDPQELAGYEVVDLEGAFMMPGLINLHVHLPASGKPKKKKTDNVRLVKIMTANGFMRAILRKICEKYAKEELASGVTTIRTVGGIENTDALIRDRINRNEIAGPRILSSNMAVSVKNGHMAGSLAYVAESCEDVIHCIEEITKSDADLVKLMITGGVLDAKKKGEPGELKMPAEFIRTACEEAHKRGFKVAAHVESPEGVRAALENGVDSIEHGAVPDEQIISLFKEHKACHVSTIIPTLSFAFMKSEITGASETERYNGKVVFDGIVGCSKACLENGIPVGLGTDTGCPFVTHSQMWREIQLFKDHCGVSNSFAIHSATLGNARIADIDGETGSIEIGKCADFLIIKNNPLEDLANLSKPYMVVARGNIDRDPKVKKVKMIEEELDRAMEAARQKN